MGLKYQQFGSASLISKENRCYNSNPFAAKTTWEDTQRLPLKFSEKMSIY